MAGRIMGWVLFALLAALYLYMVIAAVGNLVLLPQAGGAMGLSITAVGWFWLWLGAALPVVTFAIALLIGRGKKRASRLLVLATALAVTAMLQLEVLHMVPQSSFFAV